MIVNGKALLSANPIKGMHTEKKRFGGTSYGLSEAGYDLQIDQDIKFTPGSWWRSPKIAVYGVNQGGLTVPGRMTLANAMEEFRMPKGIVGVVHDKSTWARKGLSVFNTVIEPGWNGYLTLELVFHGNEELIIRRGQGIAQVLFSALIEHGDYKNGKYQNQERRPYGAIP